MSASSPLVSVLIPAYNHAAYIKRCLDSLIEDGYPNLEVVFIDDGSSDETYVIAQSWFKEHDGLFERVSALRQENIGLCRTLNKLVPLANGEYVVILASDDFLLPGGIALRLNALVNNPSWLAVFGDARVVATDGTVLQDSAIFSMFGGCRCALASNGRAMIRELVWNWCVPGPVFMARKACYAEETGVGRYDESLLVEDRDFYLRLMARQAIGYVDAAVAGYRVHQSNSRATPNSARQRKLNASMITAITKSMGAFDALDRIGLRLEKLEYCARVAGGQDGLPRWARAVYSRLVARGLRFARLRLISILRCCRV